MRKRKIMGKKQKKKRIAAAVCIGLAIVGVGIGSAKFGEDRRVPEEKATEERTAEVQEQVKDEVKEIENLNPHDNVVDAGIFEEEATDEEEADLAAAVGHETEKGNVSVSKLSTSSGISEEGNTSILIEGQGKTEASDVVQEQGKTKTSAALKGTGKTEPSKILETPAKPEMPETSETSETSDTPVKPEAPAKPETPVKPETPETPETPVKPEVPVKPETPETPDTPVKPETPETPETPVKPEVPVKPETPETPKIPEETELPETPETPKETETPEETETPSAPERPVLPVILEAGWTKKAYLGRASVQEPVQEPEIQDVDFQTVGAQIRTVEPMGLRFISFIKDEYVASFGDDVLVEYGTLLLPKVYLGSNELTIDGRYQYNGKLYKPAVVQAKKIWSRSEGRTYFTAVLTGLAPEQYQNDYVSRVYVKVTDAENNVQLIYSDDHVTKQVYQIALDACAEGSEETEETKEWMRETILKKVDSPEAPSEEEKQVKFRLGQVDMVTLYHKDEEGNAEEVSSFPTENFQKEDYLVHVELADQPDLFAGIEEVTEDGQGNVGFRLALTDYYDRSSGKDGAYVPFGKKNAEGEVETDFITMDELVQQMKANPSGSFRLPRDMDASGVAADATSKTIIPGEFTGTLDGCGYKIEGLRAPLFYTLNNGTVKNLIMEDAQISLADVGVGILSRFAEGSTTIENVHVSGTVTNTNKGNVGGLVGRTGYGSGANIIIRKCTAAAAVTGASGSGGGLVGAVINGTQIMDSYALGSVHGTNGRAWGGLVGWVNNGNSIIEHCYAHVKVSSAGNPPGGFIGLVVKAGTNNRIRNNISYSNAADGLSGYKFTGVLHTANDYTIENGAVYSGNYVMAESTLLPEKQRVGANVSLDGKITEISAEGLEHAEFYENLGWDAEVWDFTGLADGKAPKLKNLDNNMVMIMERTEISTPEELQAVKDAPDGHYVLASDIDVSGVTEGTAIIPGTFTGTLRGNGHVITGQKLPLFENLNGAVVKILALADGEIDCAESTELGALARTAAAGTKIRQVIVRNMNISGAGATGGMLGTADNTTVQECSVTANVAAGEGQSGGMAAVIQNQSLFENCYVGGSVTSASSAAQGGFTGETGASTIRYCYCDAEVVKSVSGDGQTAANGGLIGVSGADMTEVLRNIACGNGENGFRFTGQNTSQSDFDSYTDNYEYAESTLTAMSEKGLELGGKIDTASAENLKDPEFFRGLQFKDTIWNLDRISDAGRMVLQIETKYLEVEENGPEESVENTPQEGTALTEDEPAEAALEEAVAKVAVRSAGDTVQRSLAVDFSGIEGYDARRQQAYENLLLFMPFYDLEQIVKDGNQLKEDHRLNTEKVDAVYPMDSAGIRVIGLSSENAESISKLRIQFEGENTTAMYYNMRYIDTRNDIASYKISQVPIHYNFNKYVVHVDSASFQKLKETAEGYTYDTDIKGRPSGTDAATEVTIYKRNFENTVKAEMQQILVSFASNYGKYPINSDHAAAQKLVDATLIENEHLKDFLYAYNYVDRWYDFEIGGVNLRDVVIFDNSILHVKKDPVNLATEICKHSSAGGRQGNSTQSFYASRISPYTGISSVSGFVEYFMRVYAGYEDVNDWIIDNFKGGIVVETLPGNPKIKSRLWQMVKSNSIHMDQQMVLPTLSYKTSKNLYLASFPTSLVFGNLQIYSGYQNTDAWRESKRKAMLSQLNDFKNIYDNFVNMASNGAASVNASKFLIVDSSYNKDRTQDVFQEFYAPLRNLHSSKNGAVAFYGNDPVRSYIYYNSDSFIGDNVTLAHEMGHVTDRWIWLENKGFRSGRVGEDYCNGFTNQAVLDYNMNFMKSYSRDSDKMTNLTPQRICSQEDFQSFYKEVFTAIYTLDYLEGKAYLSLTPAQQAKVTLQHRYGRNGSYQTANSVNSTWKKVSEAELSAMNLQTLDDLWDNQLTIRPGHRVELSSHNNVGSKNDPGAYQIDKVCYASWYVPYVDGASPNAQIFRRNGFELGGLLGYSNGLVRYMSGQNKTGDLACWRTLLGDNNFTFESYRKNKNTEIAEAIARENLKENSYFDEEALIEYLRQALLNPGLGLDQGSSGTTLGNVKTARENVYRYLQRITDDFRSPIYTEGEPEVVHITNGAELVQKISEDPNGYYVLDNDISMADVTPGSVYIPVTFIGKLDGKGYKITDARVPLLNRISNSYVANLKILDENGAVNAGRLAKSTAYTIQVKEKMDEVKEISTLEELRTIGDNQYREYRLTADIDASSFSGSAVIPESFNCVLDGNGHTISGLKAVLFEKIDGGTVKNLTIRDVSITRNANYLAALANTTSRAQVDNINLQNISLSGIGFVAPVTGYDNAGSTFSKIQVRNAEITSRGSTSYYSSAFIGRCDSSVIRDISVLDSRVNVEKTECGGFIGSVVKSDISNVYSEAVVKITNYNDSQNRVLTAGGIGRIIETSLRNVFIAGGVDNTVEGKVFYKITASADQIPASLVNCYEYADAPGVSNITDSSGDGLANATREQKFSREFYADVLGFDPEIWLLDLIGIKGYPEIRGMESHDVDVISAPEDFAKMNAAPGIRYYITNDIDMSGYTGSLVTEPFTGTLIGGGYKISNLRQPLFTRLKGTVQDVSFENVLVTSSSSGANVLAVTAENANVSHVFFNGVTLNGQANTGIVGSDKGSAYDCVGVEGIQVTAGGGSSGTLIGSAVNSRLTNVMAAGGEITTESTYTGGMIGKVQGVTIDQAFCDVNLNLPYNRVVDKAAAFLGGMEGSNTVKNSVSAGGVHPLDKANSERFNYGFTSGQSVSGLTNCLVNGDEESDDYSTGLTETTDSALKGTALYTGTLGFDTAVWNMDSVPTHGWPRLVGMSSGNVRPPAETPDPVFEPTNSAVPEGFTGIYTAEDLLAVKNNPGGKYILMNSISLYGYRAGGTSFLGNFSGELDGNRQAITDIEGAPLFGTVSGRVHDLYIRDVRVERWGTSDAANAFAIELSGASISKLSLDRIVLVGGSYTASLAGKVTNATMSQIWADHLNINPYGPTLGRNGRNITYVGGLIGEFDWNYAGASTLKDTYVGGTIVLNGDQQGGVIGYASGKEGRVIQNVISDMRAKATIEIQNTAMAGRYRTRAGFIGEIGYTQMMWIYRCIAIGEAGADASDGSVAESYRFCGPCYSSMGNSMDKDLSTCYEVNVGGISSANGQQLQVTDQYFTEDFYEYTMGFDYDKWDFSAVPSAGHPTLRWISGE